MTNQPSSQVHEWLKCLANNGYRLTAPRRAVVEIIAGSQHVLTPYEVFVRARRRYPSLGLVTVYRTVEKLEELDLIQRVHRPSGCQAFITAFSGHEHLLICDDCGRVEFFEGDDIDPLMDKVGKKSGFQVHGHWLQLFGKCDDCQGNGASQN
jgi:Fur family transcriptional regulator, ferric uptake regulator